MNIHGGSYAAPLSSGWRRSSRCEANGNCLEARLDGESVEVRDSAAGPDGPVLSFPRSDWAALTGYLAGDGIRGLTH